MRDTCFFSSSVGDVSLFESSAFDDHTGMKMSVGGVFNK